MPQLPISPDRQSAEKAFAEMTDASRFAMPSRRTTAKLNNQHDYVSLRIKFADGATLNITRSRRGTTLSGSAATRPALAFFDTYIGQQSGQTIGQTMEAMRAKAETVSDVSAFIAAV